MGILMEQRDVMIKKPRSLYGQFRGVPGLSSVCKYCLDPESRGKQEEFTKKWILIGTKLLPLVK